ncbi:MAG: SGNH/GDSL hydrolase family protein [Planctomycetota bacterium]|jgi:lysophospholipase L1-like esterase
MGRLRKAALISIATILVLELVLQVASLVVWASHSGDETELNPARVLCVGDSYTFGVGASDPRTHGYPAQLESILQEDFGSDLRVNNRGWPGQDSRNLLARLDRDLREASPEVVCILIGCNDRWNRPAEWRQEQQAESQGETSWRWELRSLRLASLLFSGDDARLGPADEGGSSPAAKPVPKGAWNQLWAGYHEEAVASFRANVDAYPDLAPANLAGLVDALMRLDRKVEVEATLEELESLYAERQDRNAAEGLVRALAAAYKHEEARDRCLQFAVLYPDSTHIPAILGWMHYSLGDLPESERAYAQAIESLGERDPTWRANLLRNWSRSALELEPRRFVELQLRAWTVDGNRNKTLLGLRGQSSKVDRHMAEDALEGLAVGEQRDLAEGIIAEAFASPDAYAGVLAKHLEIMIQMCREAGATPVLLSYPFKVDLVRNAQQQVALALEVNLVEIRGRFTKELRTRAREELFVADGHCNDAGYRIIAEMVAAAIRGRLRR